MSLHALLGLDLAPGTSLDGLDPFQAAVLSFCRFLYHSMKREIYQWTGLNQIEREYNFTLSAQSSRS